MEVAQAGYLGFLFLKVSLGARTRAFPCQGNYADPSSTSPKRKAESQRRHERTAGAASPGELTACSLRTLHRQSLQTTGGPALSTRCQMLPRGAARPRLCQVAPFFPLGKHRQCGRSTQGTCQMNSRWQRRVEDPTQHPSAVRGSALCRESSGIFR